MDLEKIVAQAKAGELEAQSALYQQYFQKIYSLALGITKNPEDAMDICQETFLSAFQHLSSLRESAAFPHWLCQIAANQCRRLVKNKGRFLSPEQKEDEPDFFSSLPDDDPEALPEQVLDKEETRRLMEETVQQLPDVQRECVLFYYYAGLSVEEIAQVQQCSTGTVKSRLNYARQKLRQQVLAMEERDGVRYHGAIPFSLLFSRLLEQVSAPGQKEQIWQGVEKALGAAAAAGAGTAAAGALGTGAGEAAKTGLFATIKAKIIAGVTAAAVVTGGAAVVISNLPKPIAFSDPAMEQNIRVLIDKPEGKIYPKDCEELSHITILPDGFIAYTDNAFYSDPHPEEGTVAVKSLADLQKLPQVTSLQFIQGDAQPLLDTLGENPHLLEVDTTWQDTQDLTDLSFVQDLPNLRSLNCTIGDNVDLTPLETATQLRVLQLGCGTISLDLSQLTELTYLGLMPMGGGTHGGAFHLESSQPLTKLRLLQLYSGQPDSLEFLRGASSLEVLELFSYGTAVDLSPLSGLPALRAVSIDGGSCDLAPLHDCPRLEAYSSFMGQNPPSVPQIDTQVFMDTYTNPLMDEIFYGSIDKEE